MIHVVYLKGKMTEGDLSSTLSLPKWLGLDQAEIRNQKLPNGWQTPKPKGQHLLLSHAH